MDIQRVVLPLSVGGATPFPMPSLHQTVGNHAFRDAAKYDPAKQIRVKCTFCGCWATRGEICKQCKRPTAALKKRRNNNVRVEVYNGGGDGAANQNDSNKRSPSSSPNRSHHNNNTNATITDEKSGDDKNPPQWLTASGTAARSSLSSFGLKMRAELVKKEKLNRQRMSTLSSHPSNRNSIISVNKNEGNSKSSNTMPTAAAAVQPKNGSVSPTRSRSQSPKGGATVGGVKKEAATFNDPPFTAPQLSADAAPEGSESARKDDSVVQPRGPCRVVCERCGCWAMSAVRCNLCMYVNK